MDYATLSALPHQFLPPGSWSLAQKWIGDATMLLGALAAGPTVALAAADRFANAVLSSPLRPLVLWQAPRLVAYLDKISALLVQIITTFKDELEKDLAAAAPTAKPPQDVPKP